MSEFLTDGGVSATIHADCNNFCESMRTSRYRQAERDAYTLLRTLHRELPTERVQQVLAGVPIEDVLAEHTPE